MAIEKDKLIVATEVVAALNEKINTSDVLTLTDLGLSAFRQVVLLSEVYTSLDRLREQVYPF